MITQESIEALKSRVDIVDVVGSYIELKKAGVNFKALCPFHSEKTPSFVVSPSKQIYHCFSCGTGGDSIKFVMEMEKLNYPEAIEKLASSYNFSLSYSDEKKNRAKSSIFSTINSYYVNQLSKNKVALEYLKSRGVAQNSIEKFELGFAPSSKESIEFLKSNFINLDDALEHGIIGSGENGYYARFIDRLMFPITAPNGSIVGFGGRTMSNHPAKYINSPQSKYFDKSRLLYGYKQAKQSIYKYKKIIISEGYLDVIMLHQAGFEYAVATLGTALTQLHLPLLRKGEPQIIMAYDGDSAGINAAIKASKLLSASGFSGGVVVFGDGMDPADMVANGKSIELEKLFAHPKPFIEFVIDNIVASHNMQNPLSKQDALNEATEYLKTLTPLLQEEYRLYLSQRLGAINPSLIKLSKQKQTKESVSIKQKDSWEQMIIKTILEQPKFLDMLLDVIDATYFKFHSNEFNLLLNSAFDDASLVEILLDESVVSLKSEDELKSELIVFLIKHYEQLLKKLSASSGVSYEQKTFLIRKYRDNIATLKRGNLVYQ